MKKFKELANKMHDHLNKQGRFNTYVITENLDGKGICMHAYTHKKNIIDEERKSFTKLANEINPHFAKRREMFSKTKACFVNGTNVDEFLSFQQAVENHLVQSLVDSLSKKY